MDKKANRQRNIQKKFFVSELENKIIEKNMREPNLQNFSTYARKSCLDPDFREGRPKKFNQQQINLAMNLLERHSYKEVEKMTGISKSTLTRNKRKLQLSTDL